MAKSGDKKLYLIGIDSAPLWLLEEFKNAKGMEGIRKIMSEGKVVEMESTMPPMTGPAWPSIYTGLGPGGHGVPDFFYMKKDYTPDVAFFDSENVKPFWERLASGGTRCLLITPAQITRLSRNPNIDMMSGFPLRSKTNNDEIQTLMQRYKFDGEPDIENEMKGGKMSIEEGSRRYVQSIAARSRIARHMIEKHDYGFVYVCFTETDRMQHSTLNNPKYRDYLLPIYSEISKFVEYAIERAEKDGAQVLIVSDHGGQPIRQKFLVNSMLIKEGFVALKDSISSDIKKEKEAGGVSLRYMLREKLLTTRLRRVYDKMPYAMKKVVFNLSASLFSKASHEEYVHIHLYDMDMEKTKAFAAISNLVVGTIWINDSRFSKGIVSKAEKGKVIRHLVSSLSKVKAPDGKKLFAKVEPTDKYYKGTKMFITPDLFLETREGYTIDVKYFSLKSDFMRPELFKSGDHTMFGIYGALNGKVKDKMQVTDVAPQILAYFGA
ncbi:MAG: alkaline phosphatase family protein [Candidatus Micrarchaeota archaeon]|nr:alkaline phosphatase family protein [Candidatus Micrarchaeota archaeon]